MKKFLSQLPCEINLLNPNLISFMRIGGIFHLPTYVLQISSTELRENLVLRETTHIKLCVDKQMG